jgi:hypothetical protein
MMARPHDPRFRTALKKHGLRPRARVLGMATAACAPRDGHRPGARDAETDGALGLKIGDFDTIELNEAFAAQSLAVTRGLGFPTMRRTSIRMAARLRSAILWARAARALCSPPSISSKRRRQARAGDAVRRRRPRR